jgi:hypothetical protein
MVLQFFNMLTELYALKNGLQFLYKHVSEHYAYCPFYISKHSISETGFCLHLQVKPTQLGLIGRASPYYLMVF